MSFDVGARQVALEDTILGHPRYKEALRQLEASATRARNVGLAGRARIMIGGAGDGKTRLLRKLAGQPWAQPTTGSTGDQVPMRYIEVPSRVNPRELVKTILESFGERAGTRQSAEDILDDLVPLFEGVGLRLLMLDEAHWLMKSKSKEVREANAEFIKSLINRTGVSLILAGMEELDLLHDAFHAQMRRRLLHKVVLRPYRWASAAERKWFIAILHKYEEAMDLPGRSDLGGEDMARRLYLVSRGSLGVVVQYLSNALELVAARGGDRVTAADLSSAHWGIVPSAPFDLAGDMDKFEKDVVDVAGDPFLSKGDDFAKLWAAAFGKEDDSRATKLAPGPRP